MDPDPWQNLEHPRACDPENRWWLTSTNPYQRSSTSFEELLRLDDLRAVVVMCDCNSQGRTYWRCFSWIGDDGVRHLNILPAKSLYYFKLWSEPGFSVTTLFGDDDFWLIRPIA